MKKQLLSFSRIKVLPAAGVLFVFLLLLLFIRMFFVEPDTAVSRHYTRTLKNWYPEHSGMKIALLADIHLANTPRQFERLRRCVDLINQERPDFVFLLGDYMFGNKKRFRCNPLPGQLAAELERLRPLIATVAVLGNHDISFGRRTIRHALESAGIIVLENECHSITVNGKPLQLLGLPDVATRGSILWKIRWPDPEIPTLVLSHSPQYFDVLQLPYELMLTGHNHGGQVRLPFVGPLPAKLMFLSKFKIGWEEKKGHHLLNNNGFGTTGPLLRLNCPPEIVFLTIEKENPKPAKEKGSKNVS